MRLSPDVSPPGREVGWLHGLIAEDVVQNLRSLGSEKFFRDHD